MYANNTITERGQLIAGLFLTNSGKLDCIARPAPPSPAPGPPPTSPRPRGQARARRGVHEPQVIAR